ncbi:MAG: transcription antitermination factor NusB [Pseudomonadota bacterium]
MSGEASAPRPPEARPHDARPHEDRREALRLLTAALDRGRALSEAAADREAAGLAPATRARAMTLAAETLRRLGQADAAIKRFARRAPPSPAREALALAATEVFALGAPGHAAADGAVEAVKGARGGGRAAGFVNAVARRLVEEGRAAWEAQDAGRINAPGWLWGRLGSAYGRAGAQRIVEAHLRPAPLDLSVKEDAAGWAARLGGEVLPTGSVRLGGAEGFRGRVTALEGFEDGAWWVQDAAAALPARLLDARPGERVLDLCAAPGGKTMQLAAAGAEVVALDLAEARLARLEENLSRTGLRAELACADALAWEPRETFDAVLLDAPCSATGTARRHPDVLRRREAPDVKGLSALQDALLDRAWDWTAPGGRLVFATCSLLPEEGERRIDSFLSDRADAELMPVGAAALGVPESWVASGVLRTRPDHWGERGGVDGFFAAALRKAV